MLPHALNLADPESLLACSPTGVSAWLERLASARCALSLDCPAKAEPYAEEDLRRIYSARRLNVRRANANTTSTNPTDQTTIAAVGADTLHIIGGPSLRFVMNAGTR